MYAAHASNYVVPLFTLPYLARALGPEAFGVYALADSYSRIGALAIDYGLGLSLTREVARDRADRTARGNHLASALGAQAILAFVLLTVTGVLGIVWPIARSNPTLLPCACLLAVSQGLNPMWYFLGIERTRIIGGLWVAGRLMGAAILFVAVRKPADVSVALLVQGIAPLVIVVAGLVLAYRDALFVWPTPGRGIRVLRAGRDIFFSRTCSSVFGSMNVLVLGLFVSPALVAVFAGADRIARAAVGLMAPASQIFFARINSMIGSDREAAARTARVSIRMMSALGIAIGIALFALSPVLVKIVLGDGYSSSAHLLRVLSALPVLAGTADALGLQWMLSLHLDSEFSRLVLAAGILGAALSLLFGAFFRADGVAFAALCGQALLAVGAFGLLRIRRADPWQAMSENPTEVAA